MAATDPDRAAPELSAALADELERECRRLRDSLAALESSAEQSFELSCADHLLQARSGAGRIAGALARLQEAQPQSERQKAEQRRALESARAMLHEAAGSYGRLLARTASLLEQVRRELARLRQDDLALRSYRRAARIRP